MKKAISNLMNRFSVIGKKTKVKNEECVVYSLKGGTLTDKISIEYINSISILIIKGMVNVTDLMFIAKMKNLETLDMGKCRLENNNYGSLELLDIISGLVKGKKNLKEFVFPEFFPCIPSHLFDGCESLKKIIISKKVDSINSYAFTNCGIEEIVIPYSVKKIEVEAFSNCRNLKKIVVEDSDKYIAWKGKQFKDCPDIEVFYVGRNSHHETAPIVEANIKTLYLGKFIKNLNVCAQNIESIVCMAQNPPNVNTTLNKECKLYVNKNIYKYYWIHPVWGKMKIGILE